MSKKILSLVMLVMLILTCAMPVVAADRTEKANPAFSVDSVNAFAEPMRAASLFSIDQIVYYTIANKTQLNTDVANVTVVYTMDDLVSAITAVPFATLVIDASAKETVDYDMIIALSQIQHLVLIMGYTAPDKEEAEFMDEYGADMTDYNFASYFISRDGEITVFDIVNASTISEILLFANRTKDDLFVQYSTAVGEYDYLSQDHSFALINEDGVDLGNPLISVQSSAWDTASNNAVNIFHCITPGSTTGYVYDSVNGSVSVTISNGEAVLHTGTTQVSSTGYTWYKVRVWKVSGSTAVLTTGWTRDYNSIIGGDQSLPMYMYGINCGNGSTVINGTNMTGYKVRTSTSLYNSAGESVGTLAAGSFVWIANDQGYAGNSNPHYVSISSYSSSATGTKTACTSTTFVDAGFKTGSVSTYKIYTK